MNSGYRFATKEITYNTDIFFSDQVQLTSSKHLKLLSQLEGIL